MRFGFGLGALLAVGLGGCSGPPPKAPGGRTPAPGHWPQWHGPNRDNVSTETGLLREWPPGGPRLLWKAAGLGQGLSAPAVAGGLIFMFGYVGESEVATALDGAGTVAWRTRLGPQGGEHAAMRYAVARAPTVDDDRLYVVTTRGVLLCLNTSDGRILWEKDFVREFGGRRQGWGFGDYPLVDGELLIGAPGGSQGTLAALRKRSGELVWQSRDFKDVAPGAAVVLAEIGGVRQYVVLTLENLAGVAAGDGRLLWKASRRGATVVVCTPIVHGEFVFVTSGYGIGCNAFRVTSADGRFKAEEVYAGKQMTVHHGGAVRSGEHVYGLVDQSALKCVELKTGRELWQHRSVGKGSVFYADGHLVCRSETARSGAVAWVEATTEGYREKGLFHQPGLESLQSHPVIAGGRLYLRDQGSLYCYDVRGPDYREPPAVWDILARVPAMPRAHPFQAPTDPERGPDAIFVPTPQDVVERMLEMAGVGSNDVVVDLGSGDGRILITASKKYGCRSVGYEVDPDLVRISSAKLRDAGVETKAAVLQKDLFEADLTSATVVALYLGAKNNERLLPRLRTLKPGSRIVSHEHELGGAGPRPDRVVRMTSREDGSEHTVYFWTTPLSDK